MCVADDAVVRRGESVAGGRTWPTGGAGQLTLHQDYLGGMVAAFGNPNRQQRSARQVGGAEALPDPRTYILHEGRIAILDKPTGKAFPLQTRPGPTGHNVFVVHPTGPPATFAPQRGRDAHAGLVPQAGGGPPCSSGTNLAVIPIWRLPRTKR